MHRNGMTMTSHHQDPSSQMTPLWCAPPLLGLASFVLILFLGSLLAKMGGNRREKSKVQLRVWLALVATTQVEKSETCPVPRCSPVWKASFFIYTKSKGLFFIISPMFSCFFLHKSLSFLLKQEQVLSCAQWLLTLYVFVCLFLSIMQGQSIRVTRGVVSEDFIFKNFTKL